MHAPCRRVSGRRQVLGQRQQRRGEEVRGPLKGSSERTLTVASRSRKLAENRSALGLCESDKHAATNAEEARLSLTLAKKRDRNRQQTAECSWRQGRRTCNLAPCGQTPTAMTSADRAIFASERDCMTPTQAHPTDICECGAVACPLGIRVTAQVPLIHVGRLQPGVSRLRQEPDRLMGVLTPRLAYLAPDKS
jgi:hypothetical protein